MRVDLLGTFAISRSSSRRCCCPESSRPPGIVGESPRQIRVAEGRGGGDEGVGCCCSGVVGTTAEGGGAGGVLGRSDKLSNKLSTSPSLAGGLLDPAGEGGRSYNTVCFGGTVLVLGGTDMASGGEVVKIGIGSAAFAVSPDWEGKLLSSNVTSLDNLTERVWRSQSL